MRETTPQQPTKPPGEQARLAAEWLHAAAEDVQRAANALTDPALAETRARMQALLTQVVAAENGVRTAGRALEGKS